MTKYIVSGYIGFDNFGDEAIAKVLTDKLKSENAESITLISANPARTSKNYGVNACPMLGFLNYLIKSDVLISGGGSLLQDVTSLKSLIYYLGVIYLALLFHKKVIIYAQGIGPINSCIGRILTRFALRHCEKISVRDSKSQELLQMWNISAELVKDPVFSIKLAHKPVKDTVGIQLRSFSDLTDEFLQLLAEEVSVRFKNKKIKLISLQDSLDLNICEKFAEMLVCRGMNNAEIVSNLSVNEVLDEISSLEYLIAMRFHANVVAINAGIRTLAINYDPKVQKLANEFDLPMIDLSAKTISEEFDKLIRG